MSDRIPVTVTIWEQIPPADRGRRYQAPLEELFEATGRGEVTGAGTQVADTKEIECVEIELEIEDDDELVGDVVATLNGRGVPKHSQLRFHRGGEQREVQFGIAEGVSITLPGLLPT